MGLPGEARRRTASDGPTAGGPTRSSADFAHEPSQQAGQLRAAVPSGSRGAAAGPDPHRHAMISERFECRLVRGVVARVEDDRAPRRESLSFVALDHTDRFPFAPADSRDEIEHLAAADEREIGRAAGTSIGWSPPSPPARPISRSSAAARSEEHTSELQSLRHLVLRLLLL